MAHKTATASNGLRVDGLKSEVRNLVGAFSQRALSSVLEKVEESAERLQDYADNGGGAGLKAALIGASKVAEGSSPGRAALSAGMSAAKQAIGGLVKRGGGGKGGHGNALKVTNIVESIDIGAPTRTVYNQWTQFTEFPSFMKKVERVEQKADEKLQWRAQIFFSHREWEATIQQQIPDHRIVWTSKGQKGHVNGTVTFHDLGPEMCRVLLVLEYYPQGAFEQTGNLWRAQGRRARLELKHFRRHVMRNLVLDPEQLEGWRGVIEDGEVVKDHETALKEEQADEREDEGEDEHKAEDEYEANDEYEAKKEHGAGESVGDEDDEEEEEQEDEEEEGGQDEYAAEYDYEYESADDESAQRRSATATRELRGARR